MLYRFLSGDFPLTILFLVALGAFANRHWSGMRDYWTETNLFWRIVGRTTLILTVLLPIWIAAFDNWRQLLGYSLSAPVRYKSDVFDTSATPDAIRWVTLALLAISLVCVALIYARRQHGLGMIALIFVFAAAYFYFFNGIRMRADVFLATTKDSLEHPGIVNLGFTLFWSIGMYTVICSVIAAAYAWLFSALAIPLHIIFSIVTRNQAAANAETLKSFRYTTTRTPEGDVTNRGDDRGGTPPVDGKSVVR